MPLLDRTLVTSVQLWTLDIPTTDPFVVATGKVSTAQNIFVKITLKDGNTGLGEIAPFTDITEETVEESLAIAKKLAASLIGKPANSYRQLAQKMTEEAPEFPATRCGLETALLDAFCRSALIPLWALWGGADVRTRKTDITIPICDRERTMVLAREWYDKGFRLFKIKVGHEVDEDVRRIEAIYKQFSDVSFIVDPNQGFNRETASTFLQGIKTINAPVQFLEQPLIKDDVEGAAWLRRTFHLPIAADETVQTIGDAQRVMKQQAADIINLKITKSGVMETINIATLCQASGITLLIGGMVETRVAMGCSLSIVLGLGGIEYVDLDTPLLMTHDPVEGGYTYEGSSLNPWKEPGLGITMDVPAQSFLIE